MFSAQCVCTLAYQNMSISSQIGAFGFERKRFELNPRGTSKNVL